MNAFTKRRLIAAAAASLALSPLAVGGVTTAASAADRTATTDVDTTYLSDTFPGLSANTILETVTYDRFQWLLQQPGQFAFLVGSTADAGFKANLVAAEAAAKAAGATKLYWFDPNLSGYTGTRNLDTRSPGGINLAAGSQTIFGNTWKNLLGQYLGNGIKSVPNGASVTISDDDTVVNDSVDPLWDYRATGATQAPIGAGDDVFFVYDKDHTAGAAKDKVVGWTNLSTAADTAAVASGVTSDLAAVTGGAAAIDALDQFHWWKSAANSKHDASYGDDQQYGGDIVTDADDADGWRVKQITYPELVHLLDTKDPANADKNYALLFGGTWCHNTRAVLKDVNKEAQKNDVKVVYNFDLVLDGGTVNGTNGSTNPIHVRDNANSGATASFRPSYLYGDLVRKYLRNVVTEYDPNSGSRVSYFPGGDTTAFPDVVRKLQVPFVINYQPGAAPAGVKRQWIQQNTDDSTGLPTFREYMTEWWFTSKAPRLGLATVFKTVSAPGFPTELAIPASVAAAEAAPDTAFLTASEQAGTAHPAAPAAPVTLSDSDKRGIVAARRSLVGTALSNLAFAQDGLAKLKTFFGGLPGGVISDQTVTAPAATVGSAATVNVSIANDYGRIPTGNVTLTIAGTTITTPVKDGGASFSVPGLGVGSYPFTVGYAGDDQIAGFQKTGTVTVGKASVAKTAGTVVKAPTKKKAGSYKVTLTGVAGQAAPTGKVTLTLKKGAKKKTVTGILKAGTVKVKVPKLPKGTWAVAVAYAGDAVYAAGTGTGAAVKVKK